jgi:transposase
MSDLETACRELVAEWREFASDNVEWHEYNEGVDHGVKACANGLEQVLEEHTPDAADRLAAQTGEPREKFEADDKPIPELDDLDPEVKALVAQMEAAADE